MPSIADHRVLGQQLNMFSINEDIGPGLVLWHPHGAVVRRAIRDFWEREHISNGYQLVSTPHIAKSELWNTSGHIHYYRDNMYVFQHQDEHYVVKPMNCPFHIAIYQSQPRSYRELPIRYAEWGTVYRYERSGTLHGLLRVRGLTQDDAHIFCTEHQIIGELQKVLELSISMLRTFGFTDFSIELSTQDPSTPEEYMGTREQWHAAENALRQTLLTKNYQFHEEPGEAAFYGPKIDIHITDSTGRRWQCATIQFDFNLPQQFNLTYSDRDGQARLVLMVHRVVLGAIERFFGILLEHYQGNLPLWLAPIQIRLLPISEHHLSYAQQRHQELTALGYRSEVDSTSATLNYKIRSAETQKIPYIVICGTRETETNTLSIRKHQEGALGSFTLQEFRTLLNTHVN
jgi:threonyl-tRNA synthetase